MKYFGNNLSDIHKQLSKIIRKKDCIEQSKDMFFEIHSSLNMSSVYGVAKNDVDRIFENISDNQYAVMQTKDDETIAWVLWHIARIEDITMNILVADTEQVFNDEWKQKLGVVVSDTGNSWSDDEIMDFSKAVNKNQLIIYRNEVAKRTREIVKNLRVDDMKRHFDKAQLQKIFDEGAVTTDENSIWLVDYWGKKDVAGLLLMPPTRHVILHLNDVCKWIEGFSTRKTIFRT